MYSYYSIHQFVRESIMLSSRNFYSISAVAQFPSYLGMLLLSLIRVSGIYDNGYSTG